MKLKLALAGAITLVATGAAFAHHKFSDVYDASAPMTWTGTIVKVDFINPHAQFEVAVPGASGSVTWRLQAGGPGYVMPAFPSARSKAGVAALAGTPIEARGYRANGVSATCKQGCTGTIRTLIMNGKSFFVGTPNTGAPKDGADPSEP